MKRLVEKVAAEGNVMYHQLLMSVVHSSLDVVYTDDQKHLEQILQNLGDSNENKENIREEALIAILNKLYMPFARTQC